MKTLIVLLIVVSVFVFILYSGKNIFSFVETLKHSLPFLYK